ncbi:MAG: hypothetical protein JSU01_18515 [Bacteroidetes bacterium]|nr:hypothetical protein [Bacteroidota bacterium]
MAILILYAKVKLPNGDFAMGPVTTQDFHEFLFRNTGSDLDLYFNLKKDDSVWHFSGGPSIPIPASLIEQVGQQIDQELVTR